jgi:hypothetical protein
MDAPPQAVVKQAEKESEENAGAAVEEQQGVLVVRAVIAMRFATESADVTFSPE